MVPPEQLRETFEVKPTRCGGCGASLRGEDPEPVRHQVAEIPPVRPDVDEYRLHRLTCPCCGAKTRADLPPGGPSGPSGPRLRAILAMFAGSCRLAKRPIQQLVSDLFGLDVSLGMISKLERQAAAVLAPVVAEVAAAIEAAPSAHIDETSWSEAAAKAWLWVGLTDDLTACTIADNRGADVARSILGTDGALSAGVQEVAVRAGGTSDTERRWVLAGIRDRRKHRLSDGRQPATLPTGPRDDRLVAPPLGPLARA